MKIFKTIIAVLCCFCGFSFASDLDYVEADIETVGLFSLSRQWNKSIVIVDIHIDSLKREEYKPFRANFNILRKIIIKYNRSAMTVPEKCRTNLTDISYVRLEKYGSDFRYWIQGGDASEAYQVSFTIDANQRIMCDFYPKVHEINIKPMLSRKNINLLNKP